MRAAARPAAKREPPAMALSAAPVYWAGMLAEAEAEPDGTGAALAGGTAAPVAAPVGAAWIWPSLR